MDSCANSGGWNDESETRLHLSRTRAPITSAWSRATAPRCFTGDADWVSLGSGISFPGVTGGGVYALAVSGTNLYAGGCFSSAGGVTANYIAKWDGNAWSALGSGMGGWAPSVSALAVTGTNLYAGGLFEWAGEVGAYGIAKWDGSSWSALGSGMGGDCLNCPNVRALAVSGNDLYAGGNFTTAGGVAATNIAKWDGSTWSALGSGVDNQGSGIADNNVWALVADGVGHLFVSGGFYVAGTNLSPFIAQANLIPPGGAIQNIGLGAGSVTLDFFGLPGSVYQLQRATDVRFTRNQTTLLTTNPPSPDGLCGYTDTSPPTTAAFYRLQRQ
jgi:hypothetical protein